MSNFQNAIHQANGEIFMIPCGLDLNLIPQGIDWHQKEDKILIAALKEPELGQTLKIELEKIGKTVELLTA